MKKLSFLILFIMLCLSQALRAQTYEQQKVQLQFFNHYGQVGKTGSKSSDMLGSQFFNDEWMQMDIKLQGKDTLIRFDAVKMNLVNSNLEVFFQNQEKIIAGHHFEYVLPGNGSNNIFVPANIFYYEGKPLTGFMEVIGTGREKVLVQHYAYLREPNAQAHIVGGYTVNRLLKESNNFLYDGEKLVMVKRKKDLQTYYYRKNNALNKYLKQNDINLKDPYSLLKLTEDLSGSQP